MPDAEQALLSRKISELPLRIEGTPLERLVSQLYRELERAGISMRPATYLSDGWGCPDRVPVIGIPFYQVDPELRRLEARMTGIEAADDAEAMMVLRHEAGHAFNYSYRLYTRPAWRKLFGRFSQPYIDNFRVVPFSARFVRHVPGWYVQRHPDDDFAETFAVWLEAGTDWRKRYADTPALAKLDYVDRMVKRHGRLPPVVTGGRLDMPLEEMTMTLGEWYGTDRKRRHGGITLHNIIDEDLKRLFPAAEGQPAGDILGNNRRTLVREIYMWTGVDQRVLAALVDEIIEHVRRLGLKIDPAQTEAALVGISVFATTLAMNYLDKGRFIEA